MTRYRLTNCLNMLSLGQLLIYAYADGSTWKKELAGWNAYGAGDAADFMLDQVALASWAYPGSDSWKASIGGARGMNCAYMRSNANVSHISSIKSMLGGVRRRSYRDAIFRVQADS